MTNGMTIRDFIYVDAERLYSLYSQVFEGVAEQIVESFIAELTSSESHKGSIMGGSSKDAQVAEASRRTENKSLYDHMYNRLERKLDAVITNATDITLENYHEVLTEAFMIKVSGPSEIEDYERIDLFMKRFNELADVIGYSQLHGIRTAIEAGWKEKESEINQLSDRNKKAAAQRQLDKEKKDFEKRVQDFLEQSGLRQDEKLLGYLRLFIEIFNPHGFEITVNPPKSNQKIVYRGVVDRKWLRVQPDFLRALYGQAVKSTWTMVGKITYIPYTDLPNERTLVTPPDNPGVDDENNLLSKVESTNPSMRDPFRNMFTAARAFDQMFLESSERVEILIAPLAIYHEIEIPDVVAEDDDI